MSARSSSYLLDNITLWTVFVRKLCCSLIKTHRKDGDIKQRTRNFCHNGTDYNRPRYDSLEQKI